MNKEQILNSLTMKKLRILANECNISLKNKKNKKEIVDLLVEKKNKIPLTILKNNTYQGKGGTNEHTACIISDYIFDQETLKNLKLVSSQIKSHIDSKKNEYNTLDNTFEYVEKLMNDFSNCIPADFEAKQLYLQHICKNADSFFENNGLWDINDRLAKNGKCTDDEKTRWSKAFVLFNVGYMDTNVIEFVLQTLSEFSDKTDNDKQIINKFSESKSSLEKEKEKEEYIYLSKMYKPYFDLLRGLSIESQLHIRLL